MWVIGSMSVCGPASDLPNSSLLLVCHSDGRSQTSTHAIGKKDKIRKEKFLSFLLHLKPGQSLEFFWKWHVGILIDGPYQVQSSAVFHGNALFLQRGPEACGNIDRCCLSVVTNDFREVWPETLISKHFDFLCSQPCTAAVTFCKKKCKTQTGMTKDYFQILVGGNIFGTQIADTLNILEKLIRDADTNGC